MTGRNGHHDDASNPQPNGSGGEDERTHVKGRVGLPVGDVPVGDVGAHANGKNVVEARQAKRREVGSSGPAPLK